MLPPDDAEAVNVTDPVGVGLPVPPLTVTFAESACAVVIDGGVLSDTLGVTNTVSLCVAVFGTCMRSPEYRTESWCWPTGDKLI